jgi:sulfate/thiosulfate transport system ATP-binding protein
MGISVKGVSKRFGDFSALDDITLDVREGSLTALLGPSGSGKSTLLRVIAGLESPDRGQVIISGEDQTTQPVRSRDVGFVFQHYAAFKHMTVRDNVAFGLSIRKRPKEEIADRVDELLELVHLAPFGHRYPNQLSGGQRQRMALARALAVQPKVLLLDEPFGALDARVRKELRAWLQQLHEEVHVTTVFVTHDQEEAMEVAEQIVLMDEGTIQQIGGPRDLYERPANEFVMSFIGPVTRLGDEYVRPHDFEILASSHDGAREATIRRVTYLGFEVRVEFTFADGTAAWVQLTRLEHERLGVEAGETVWVRPRRSVSFADGAGPDVRGEVPLEVAG